MADIGLCIAGRERLMKESVRVAFRVFQPIAADRCRTRPGCLEGFRQMSMRLGQHVDAVATLDPSGAFYDKFAKGDLCMQCRTMVMERDVCERKAFWDKLP